MTKKEDAPKNKCMECEADISDPERFLCDRCAAERAVVEADPGFDEYPEGGRK